MPYAGCRKGDTDIADSSQTITVVIKFGISGRLRFLSHAETMTLFQRVCVRAGINLRYSQGFNPRPKLSLALPRPVGVESDDEIAALSVTGEGESFNSRQFASNLCGQLPEGIKILSALPTPTKRAPVATAATYVLQVQPKYIRKELMDRIAQLMEADTLNLDRVVNQRGGVRKVDVRGFLKSIEMQAERISVECEISNAGTIRVEEILQLLQLDISKLAAPIRRVNVRWRGQFVTNN